MRIFENVNILENGDILINSNTENFHHIYNVLRVKVGEKVEVVDVLSKKLYITEVKDKFGNLTVEKIIESEENKSKITIYQAAIKGERFEYFLEENEIVKKEERFRKILESSSKQSRRVNIPEIKILGDMKQTLKEIEKEDIVFVLYENILEDSISMKKMVDTIIEGKYKNIGIVIGAEGGIDISEIEELRKCENIKIVTLGKRILRAETAGVSVMSILNYELER